MKNTQQPTALVVSQLHDLEGIDKQLIITEHVYRFS